MITAIDTNVLLDIFLPENKFTEPSANLIRRAYDEGALIICEIVYSELVPQFPNKNLLHRTLETISVTLSPMNADVAFLAGRKWSEYRKSGGQRRRIITDFLIGAHASKRADRFLTRDRGFYSSYFPDLKILS
jgi:predicted nucleic acid-binding protein